MYSREAFPALRRPARPSWGKRCQACLKETVKGALPPLVAEFPVSLPARQELAALALRQSLACLILEYKD
jgi:hypothetical protein